METIDRVINILKQFEVKKVDGNITFMKMSRWKEFPDLLAALESKKGVEVGVYKADYSKCLVDHIPGLDLTGVDAWKVYKGYKDYHTTDLEVDAYDIALARANRKHFKLMRMWSAEAAPQFEDNSLDFVFIDGNHDFQHVVEDLAAWSPKVKKGGIVSGHDFWENRTGRYGVVDALKGWVHTNGIEHLFIISDDKCPSWFYVKGDQK